MWLLGVCYPKKSKTAHVLALLDTSLKGVHFIADPVLLSPVTHVAAATTDYIKAYY